MACCGCLTGATSQEEVKPSFFPFLPAPDDTKRIKQGGTHSSQRRGAYHALQPQHAGLCLSSLDSGPSERRSEPEMIWDEENSVRTTAFTRVARSGRLTHSSSFIARFSRVFSRFLFIFLCAFPTFSLLSDCSTGIQACTRQREDGGRAAKRRDSPSRAHVDRRRRSQWQCDLCMYVREDACRRRTSSANPTLPDLFAEKREREMEGDKKERRRERRTEQNEWLSSVRESFCVRFWFSLCCSFDLCISLSSAWRSVLLSLSSLPLLLSFVSYSLVYSGS